MTPWEYEPVRTDRLLLRLMVDDDLDDVHAWMSDEAVTRYQLYDVRSREQVQEHIDKVKDARRLEKTDDFVELDPRNAPSITLCRKLGLREEALHVEDLWFTGAWADTGIYAILDREWRALSA